MKQVLSMAMFGFVVAFIAGAATVGSPDSETTEAGVMPPNCTEICGGAYIIVRGQCVCM